MAAAVESGRALAAADRCQPRRSLISHASQAARAAGLFDMPKKAAANVSR
jgi:hypothetical protein